MFRETKQNIILLNMSTTVTNTCTTKDFTPLRWTDGANIYAHERWWYNAIVYSIQKTQRQ